MATTTNTNPDNQPGSTRRTSVLISGANRGLGLQTATELSQMGWTVWLGSRDLGAGVSAAATLKRSPGDVRPIALDVTSDESIDAAVATVVESKTGLDVLINNAGVAIPGVETALTTPADFLVTFGVNVLGPVRMTRAFLPLLQESSDPRVVMVSSGMGSFAVTTDPDRLESTIANLVYPSSKAALNMITLQYSKALPGIRVNAVDPGYTATDLNGHSGHKTVEEGARVIVDVASAAPGDSTGGFFDDRGRVQW